MSTDKNNLVYQDQLDDNVIEMLSEDIGSNYSLRSENQRTIVAALNEINGKDIISSAVGSPLLSTDTFSSMGEKIRELTANFKSKLLELGVSVSGTDKIKSLIEKLDGIDLNVDADEILNQYIETLKEILTDEGVELTGEESMADLIVKVDEEFDAKNEEIETGKCFDIITATELPSTVVENQIVAITDTEATEIAIFDTVIGELTVDGGLTIGITNEINGFLYETSNNNIYLRAFLDIAKQQINGVATTLDGYIGINGSWVQFSEAESSDSDSGDEEGVYYIYNNGVWADGYELDASYGNATVTENRNYINVNLVASSGSATASLTTNKAVSLESYDTIVFKFGMTNNGTTVSSYNFSIGYDSELSQIVVSPGDNDKQFTYTPTTGLTGSPRMYISYSFSSYTSSIDFDIYEIYLANYGVMATEE